MLDRTVIHVVPRWLGLAGLLALYALRVYYAQGWYIVTYGLGISLLNQFIGFISPQVRPPLRRVAWPIGARLAGRCGAGMATGSHHPSSLTPACSRSPSQRRHVQIDPDAAGSDGPLLPINGSEEFRPFRRRVPEFQFWCVPPEGVIGDGGRSRFARLLIVSYSLAPLHTPSAAGTRRSGRRACAS